MTDSIKNRIKSYGIDIINETRKQLVDVIRSLILNVGNKDFTYKPKEQIYISAMADLCPTTFNIVEMWINDNGDVMFYDEELRDEWNCNSLSVNELEAIIQKM